MIAKLDLCGVAKTAEDLGFTRADGAEIEAVPSMVLGVNNASPLTMAVVAATIANDGVRCEPLSLISMTGRDGTEYEVPPQLCRQTIEADVARGVSYAMTRVMENGSGTRLQLDGRRSAGKTGTAQENTHTWFMGFVPQLATVTWLGHPDRDVPQQNIKLNGTSYRYVFGSTISGPTWQAYMNKVLKGQKVLSLPSSVPSSLGNVQIVVPDVRGMDVTEAKNAINDAGLRWAVDSVKVFTTDVPPDHVVLQSHAPDTVLGPSATVSIALARNSLPSWWTSWPGSWSPCSAPSDYWGDVWPPPEFSSSPPAGWDYSPCLAPPPSPSPSPSPSP